MREYLNQIFSQTMGISPELLGRLLNSVIIIVVLMLVRFVLLRTVYRRTDDVTRQYYWRKATTYITTIIAIFLVGRLWFQGIQSLATFFGLAAAGWLSRYKTPS